MKSWFKNRRYRQKKTEHQHSIREHEDGAEPDASQQDDKSASPDETFDDNEDIQDQENTMNSDSTDINTPAANHSILKQQLNQSSSLLAAAALAAVTTNLNNGGSPLFSYQPSSYQYNSLKITKALNDELELVFEKQQYISNTQRDFLAEKFQVASAQITNWFQNKRRKLKRLERLANSSKTASN